MPILCLIVAAALWGGSFAASRAAVLALPPVSVAFLRSLLTAGVMAPLALRKAGWAAAHGAPAAFWWQMAYLVVAGTVLAFTLWYRGVAALGAARSGAFLPLVPVSGLILSALFLDERPGLLQVAGGALVMASARLASRPAPGPFPHPGVPFRESS